MRLDVQTFVLHILHTIEPQNIQNSSFYEYCMQTVRENLVDALK